MENPDLRIITGRLETKMKTYPKILQIKEVEYYFNTLPYQYTTNFSKIQLFFCSKYFTVF